MPALGRPAFVTRLRPFPLSPLCSSASSLQYLYAAYMARNPSFGNNCTDNGMANGRPNSAIAGCPTTAQISRWRLVDGAVIGNEQPLIGGFNLVCAQFRVHGVDYLLAQDNVLYFSVGAGDNANIQPDYGQFGGDPCGGGGAFRAQDAHGLNGKIMRYDIASNTTTVLAKGLKNPWRFTIANTGIYTGEWAASLLTARAHTWPPSVPRLSACSREQLPPNASPRASVAHRHPLVVRLRRFAAEPGAGIYDEINGPVSLSATTPVNYGAPCWEGINNPSATVRGRPRRCCRDAAAAAKSSPIPPRPTTLSHVCASPRALPPAFLQYMASNATLCSAVAPAASVTNPVYAYSPPDANSRISISAIGFRPAASRIYWGDYTASMISSMSLSGTDVRLEATGMFPVDMAYVQGYGIVYVDIVKGKVKSLPNTDDTNGASASTVAALALTAVAAVSATLLL